MASHLDPEVELVTCSLCYEVYNHTGRSPKGLPCMHTFCLECLEKFVKNKVDFQLPCPLCQTNFTVPQDGVQAIPTNTVVRQLLDNMSMKVTPGDAFHTGKVASDAICGKHNREGCEFVCTTCLVPLCWECIKYITKGPHATHTLDDIQDVVAADKNEYKEFKENIAEIEVKSNKAYEYTSSKYSVSKDEALAKAGVKSERVIAEAVEWKNTTVAKINAAFDEKTRELQLKQDKQLSIKENMNETMKQIEKCLDRCDIENYRKNLNVLTGNLEEFEAGIPNTQQVELGHITDAHSVDLGEFQLSSSTMDVKCELVLLANCDYIPASCDYISASCDYISASCDYISACLLFYEIHE